MLIVGGCSNMFLEARTEITSDYRLILSDNRVIARLSPVTSDYRLAACISGKYNMRLGWRLTINRVLMIVSR